MSRYSQQDQDQAIIDAGYPPTQRGNTDPKVRRALANAVSSFHRCQRRLYLSRILEDVDTVVGNHADPALYGSAIVSLALYDIELEVNMP